MQAVERFLNNVENFLSRVSAVPILGIGSGVAKIALGVSQTALAVLSFPFTIIYDSRAPKENTSFHDKVSRHSIRHVAHGIGNVVAGGVEAIPIAGTISYLWRNAQAATADGNILVHESGIFQCCKDGSRSKNWKFLSYSEI